MALYLCVSPSVCLSQAGVLSKRLNMSPRRENDSLGTLFYNEVKELSHIAMGSLLTATPNARVVEKSATLNKSLTISSNGTS